MLINIYGDNVNYLSLLQEQIYTLQTIFYKFYLIIKFDSLIISFRRRLIYTLDLDW